MAEKAKSSIKTKKITNKPATTAIKSTVAGKKKVWEKPCIGKIVCFCVVVVVLVVIIIATMVPKNTISDGYFVSDDTKYVLNIEADEDNEEKLVGTHIVYYYSGEDITGAEVFYEFTDADTAKTTYNKLMETLSGEEGVDTGLYKLNGKYIVVIAEKDSYTDLKASDVKAQIESYEALQNGTIKESENPESSEEESEEQADEE